jgi:hypothetical protein
MAYSTKNVYRTVLGLTILLASPSSYAVDPLPEGPLDCAAVVAHVTDELQTAQAKNKSAVSRNDRTAVCNSLNDLVYIDDRVMEMYARGCQANNGKTNVEVVTPILAEREKLLETQEAQCVGIGPIMATPPGTFNCHSVIMRVIGRYLLVASSYEDAARINDKAAKCVALKNYMAVFNEAADLSTRPGCYTADGRPGPFPAVAGDKIRAMIQAECH